MATAITASLVTEAQRLEIPPVFEGDHHGMTATIRQVMTEYTEGYQPSRWLVWELSNGAFYLAPGRRDIRVTLCRVGIWYFGSMSADAAGIAITLLAFHRLATRTRETHYIAMFKGLRGWACQHPEAREILAVID